MTFASREGVEHLHIVIDLCYPAQGMTFSAEVGGTLEKPEVGPTDPISSIHYYRPYESVEQWRQSVESDELRAAPPWPGYGPLRTPVYVPLR